MLPQIIFKFQRLDADIQLSQTPYNRDHCSILADFKGKVWQEMLEAAKQEINMDEMMEMWLGDKEK